MSTTKLTVTAVKNSKPDTILADAPPHRGLRLVTSPNKVRTFVYRYVSPVTGKLRQMKIGHFPAMTLDIARDRHRKLQRIRNEGLDPADTLKAKVAERKAAAAVAEITVSTVVDAYLDGHVDVARMSPGETRRIFAKLLRDRPAFANQPASKVSRADIQALVDEKARTAPSIATAIRKGLAAAYEFAIGRGLLPEELRNPADKVKAPSARSRSRAFTDAELATFYRWLQKPSSETKLSDNIRDALLLTLLTGARTGEVVATRWVDISLDTDAPELRIPQPKNRRPHVVYLSRQAADLLRARRTQLASDRNRRIQSSPWVFPSRVELGRHVVQQSLRQFVDKADKPALAPYTPHDLRRSVGTGLARLGAPRQVADRILNHVDSSVSGIYDRHGYDNEAREWWQRWADHIENLQSPSVVPLRSTGT